MPEYEIKVYVYKKGSSISNSVWNATGISDKTTLSKVDLWWPRGYGDASLYVLEVGNLILK